MADKNQLKIANQIDFSDDDPFAELTRIMGFDPRQPATRAEPAAASGELPAESHGTSAEAQSAASAESSAFFGDEDFSLDLEKELLGSFDMEQDFGGPETEFAPAENHTPPSASQSALAEDDFDFSGEFEAAFAAPAEAAAPLDDFDFALTDEDMDSLADVASAPEMITPPADSGADDDTGLSMPDQGVSAEEVSSAHGDDAPDEDFGLFGDVDFSLAEENDAATAQAEARTEAADLHDSVDAPWNGAAFEEAFLASDEDEAASPEGAAATESFAEELSFDEVDFGEVTAADDDAPAVSQQAPHADEISANEPPSSEQPVEEPVSSGFEFSVPPYVPRKLPVSPMDVAAEEYRQREAVAASAKPDFNLEDELNALLGNIRTDPTQAAPPPAETQAEPVASLPDESDVSGYPMDIEDDLNWELESAFAVEAGPEGSGESPADAYGPEADAYGPESDGTYHDAYYDDDVSGPDMPEEAAQDTVAFDEPSEYREPVPVSSYGAAAGMAAGYAASHVSTGAAQAGNMTWNAARSEPQQGAAAFNPHRDPVVRGDPLREDPLHVIEQLADKYARGETHGYSDTRADGHDDANEFDDDFNLSDFFGSQPEVETVEVDDRAVSLAPEFEIPELPAEEIPPPAAPYDDLDSEFASLLRDMNAEPEAPKATGTYPLSGNFDTRAAPGVERQATHGFEDARHDPAADSLRLDDEFHAGFSDASAQYADDEGDFDPEFGQEYRPNDRQDRRFGLPPRGLLIAGLVAGVAIIGAIGAFALSFGGGEDAPVLVRADEGPVKIRPENPGGTTVPNQDSKVYQTVAGGGVNAGPQQETLVTTAEEPVDVAPPDMEEDDVALSGKNEDRIEQIVREAEGQTDAELVAVAPRKVRTLVVRPDGTLVEREDEPAVGQAEQGGTVAAVTPEAPPATEAPAAAEVPAEGTAAPAPAQVAAAATAAASADGWAMQIASQPSEAAAQASYQDLAGRYASVLQGRDVNIVKAEIDGKGTFWRVRVPASTRNEAINLCESYKAAGGSCFVSR